jgi:Arc/MetJ-type ribon-helix-helix transcriptional regulator
VIRTQIQLTERQAERLRKVAAERGESVSSLIRDAVDQILDEDERAARRRRALQAIGGFRSDRADISERHDDYLADAFAE